jgi:hypothetical protein
MCIMRCGSCPLKPAVTSRIFGPAQVGLAQLGPAQVGVAQGGIAQGALGKALAFCLQPRQTPLQLHNRVGEEGHRICTLDFGPIAQELGVHGDIHCFEGAANCDRYQNARRGLGGALMVSSGGL